LTIFFPDDAEIPKLKENEKESCEGMISEEECVKAIKSMQNGKSPGTTRLFFNRVAIHFVIIL
jgi:hypothetical protein